MSLLSFNTVLKSQEGMGSADPTNPVQQIAIPEAQKSRERRLEEGESNF